MSPDTGTPGGPGSQKAGCHPFLDLLPLHFYGLVEGEELGDLQRHLLACAGCAGAWSETRAVLGQVRTPAAFPREEDVDWGAFARQTVARARADDGRDEPAARPAGAWIGRLRPSFVWGGLLAAAATLVLVAGLRSLRVPETPRTAEAGSSVSPEATRFLQESLARQGAARYLRDSRSLLVDLVHAPVRCRRADGSLDISLEKQRSQDLLRRKNLYLGTLAGPRDQRLSELMQQLESLLVQVSSLDDCAGVQQIHDLRLEIERRQILLRIDLIAREVEGGADRA